MPHRISSFRHACKHKGQIIKDSCNPPKGRSSKNYSGHFFTPWVTILLVHELQKTITRIVIWSLPCLSVKHIMRFQESGQQAWLVKKIFELKHPALLIGEPHSLYGEGGGGVRGESWKLILYCIFSGAARPLKLYIFCMTLNDSHQCRPHLTLFHRLGIWTCL